jgi:tetratricopeptide (TPR) repeat protein/predicted Ser/Thr protein kinase
VTPERLRQIEALFHAVKKGSAAERAALLARAEPELRQEVESLLARQSQRLPLDQAAIDVTRLQDPHASTVAAGTLLGPYRVDVKIGEGGMGEVFRAIDTRLGRAVAVKITDDRFSARFEREARAISSLNHPNICTLYDVGPHYLVMELVEGETLASRLTQGPLPMDLVLSYGGQILAALVEAHEKGIVHRDLKPGNVMLTKTGAKVLDFGLAAVAGEATLTGEHMILGTPAYMAPEQREGKRADARSDIYAFGCVLYEMLTGARVGLPRTRIASRRLATIVNRCLEANPERRWQSAAALQQEFTAITPPRRATRAASARPAPLDLRQPSPLTGGTIVLADFDNGTDEPVFDQILRQGLAVQLRQSPFLTLVSDQQIAQALRFMNRPPDTRLTLEIAREVCERTGSAAVLEGSIARLGSQYVLWLRARRCRTGEVVGEEQAQAAGKEEVLNALTRIAVQIRRRLGESLATIHEHSTPLEQATTSSLEALKAYSAGRIAVYSRGPSAAIPELQRAIAIDPQFAMAHADLSILSWNMGQTDLAAEHTLKAYELRDRVSDRERRWILFLYDRQVTGNLPRLLQTLESWVQTYPRDHLPLGVLAGWGTRGTGQYERGIQAAEASLRLNPDETFAYEGLLVHNLSLERFADAADALRRAAERKLEIAEFLVGRYYLAFFDGDEAGMAREVARARGLHGAEDWMSHNQAMVLARSGRMREARVLWQRAIESTQQTGDREKAAIYHAAAAVCEAHCGNSDAAAARARSALDLAKGRDVAYAAAFALALSGDLAASETLAEDLQNRFPEDTAAQFGYLPVLRALSALAHGAPLEAIERLQSALPYEFAMPGTVFFAKFGGLYPAYVRGQAYLADGRGQQAAVEFHKVLGHRGLVFADPIAALAHLQLARALALAGQPGDASRAYETFLAVWKDADADLPILKQANAEYVTRQ